MESADTLVRHGELQCHPFDNAQLLDHHYWRDIDCFTALPSGTRSVPRLENKDRALQGACSTAEEMARTCCIESTDLNFSEHIVGFVESLQRGEEFMGAKFKTDHNGILKGEMLAKGGVVQRLGTGFDYNSASTRSSACKLERNEMEKFAKHHPGHPIVKLVEDAKICTRRLGVVLHDLHLIRTGPGPNDVSFPPHQDCHDEALEITTIFKLSEDSSQMSLCSGDEQDELVLEYPDLCAKKGFISGLCFRSWLVHRSKINEHAAWKVALFWKRTFMRSVPSTSLGTPNTYLAERLFEIMRLYVPNLTASAVDFTAVRFSPTRRPTMCGYNALVHHFRKDGSWVFLIIRSRMTKMCVYALKCPDDVENDYLIPMEHFINDENNHPIPSPVVLVRAFPKEVVNKAANNSLTVAKEAAASNGASSIATDEAVDDSKKRLKSKKRPLQDGATGSVVLWTNMVCTQQELGSLQCGFFILLFAEAILEHFRDHKDYTFVLNLNLNLKIGQEKLRKFKKELKGLANTVLHKSVVDQELRCLKANSVGNYAIDAQMKTYLRERDDEVSILSLEAFYFWMLECQKQDSQEQLEMKRKDCIELAVGKHPLHALLVLCPVYLEEKGKEIGHYVLFVKTPYGNMLCDSCRSYIGEHTLQQAQQAFVRFFEEPESGDEQHRQSRPKPRPAEDSRQDADASSAGVAAQPPPPRPLRVTADMAKCICQTPICYIDSTPVKTFSCCNNKCCSVCVHALIEHSRRKARVEFNCPFCNHPYPIRGPKAPQCKTPGCKKVKFHDGLCTRETNGCSSTAHTTRNGIAFR